MNTYELGDIVQLTGTFQVGGVDTDPTAVTAEVIDELGNKTTLSASRSSAGIYTTQFTPVNSGMHTYRFAGTGTATAADEERFYVKASAF